MNASQLEALILAKTRRVVVSGEPGDGSAVARQFDAVALCAGFKCSRDLLERLSGIEAGRVIDIATAALEVVREQAGDHVRHNSYFLEFPRNVPDTAEFWVQCLREALLDPVTAGQVEVEGSGPDGRAGFFLNLLSLPSYGRYQHSYEDMLAAHDELIPAVSDRVTVLHLGGALDDEARDLYLRLAGSAVPLSAGDTDALRLLARWCADGPPPDAIPARESRAVINAARLRAGLPPLVTTVTDVLRLACELAGGDVSLREPTRFGALRRREREALMAALDAVAEGPKLADVGLYAERWKRLGERVHPHDYPRYPRAAEAFAVARGEVSVPSFGGQVEAAFARSDVDQAVRLLRTAPGRLWRSADRLFRAAQDPAAVARVMAALGATAPEVSGRVLLSVREHLQNRAFPGSGRLFANRLGRAWAAPDWRDTLDRGVIAEACALIDAEIMRRLPPARLVVDAGIAGAALPLSGKPLPAGLGIFPRGSVTKVDGDLLRFFIYWRQKRQRTDYDLSALFLDEQYANPRHISWTRLSAEEAEHSGDITQAPAPDGASEFINIRLTHLGRGFIVPQVYIYAGEGFGEVEESFFGFMTRDGEQAGQPFEARTVRMKSALYSPSRTAVPLVFSRGEDGAWRAKWLHLYLRGHGTARWGGPTNQVEGGRVTATMLARSVVEREYLRVGYLAGLWRRKGCEVLDAVPDDTGPEDGDPVTYIGLERPEGLPDGSEVFTLDRLGDLIPA
ncbi:MAG TPA: TerD family protein [Streptosporangiaceae bacterium]|nr:TerD family protein [Streptosporangiaceae bacterium]